MRRRPTSRPAAALSQQQLSRAAHRVQVLAHAKQVMVSLPPPAEAARPASPPAYDPRSPAAASPAHAEAGPSAAGAPEMAGQPAADAAAAKRKAAATPGSPAQVRSWLLWSAGRISTTTIAAYGM